MKEDYGTYTYPLDSKMQQNRHLLLDAVMKLPLRYQATFDTA